MQSITLLVASKTTLCGPFLQQDNWVSYMTADFPKQKLSGRPKIYIIYTITSTTFYGIKQVMESAKFHVGGDHTRL